MASESKRRIGLLAAGTGLDASDRGSDSDSDDSTSSDSDGEAARAAREKNAIPDHEKPAVNFFRPLIRGLHVCRLEDALRATGTDFRARNITHVLLLANQTVGTMARVVQMNVSTSDNNNFECLAFIKNGRAVGGVLMADKTGGGEAACIFLALIMEMGMTQLDATKYLLRRSKAARANAGFMAQLQAFAKWPGISSQNISPIDQADLFPDMADAIAAAGAGDSGSDSDSTVLQSDEEPPAVVLDAGAAGQAAGSASVGAPLTSRSGAAVADDAASAGGTSRATGDAKWAKRRRSSVVVGEVQGVEGEMWLEYEDPITGEAFFFCEATQQSRWMPPEAATNDHGHVIGPEPVVVKGIGEVPPTPAEMDEKHKAEAADLEAELAGMRRGGGADDSEDIGDAVGEALLKAEADAAPMRRKPRRSSITIKSRADLLWQEVYDMDALAVYYVNRLTGYSQWEKPDDIDAPFPEGATAFDTEAVDGAGGDGSATGGGGGAVGEGTDGAGVDSDGAAEVKASAPASDEDDVGNDDDDEAAKRAERLAKLADDSSDDDMSPLKRAAAESDDEGGGGGADAKAKAKASTGKAANGDGVAEAMDGDGERAAGGGAATARSGYSAGGAKTDRSGAYADVMATGDGDGATGAESMGTPGDGAMTERTAAGATTARTDRSEFDDLGDGSDSGAGSVGGLSKGARSAASGAGSRRGGRRNRGAAAGAGSRVGIDRNESRRRRKKNTKDDKPKKKAPRITRYLYNEAEFKVTLSGNPIYVVRFAKDGDHVLSSDGDGNCKMSIWRSGGLVARLTQSAYENTHRAWNLAAMFTPDGHKHILSMSFNGDCKLWENPVVAGKTLSKGRDKLPTMLQHLHGKLNFEAAPSADPRAYRCCSVTIAKDMSMLATTSETGQLRLYGTPKARATVVGLKVPLAPWQDGFNLMATYRGLHFNWDEVGNPVTELVTRVRISPDKKYIATAGLDGRIIIWSTDLLQLRTLPAHMSQRRCSHVFQPKNLKLDASLAEMVKKRSVRNVAEERKQKKKEARRARQKRRLDKEERDKAIYCIAWNKKSTMLAAGSEGGFVSLYNVKTGKRAWRTAVTAQAKVRYTKPKKASPVAADSDKAAATATTTDSKDAKDKAGGDDKGTGGKGGKGGKGAAKKGKGKKGQVTPSDDPKSKDTGTGGKGGPTSTAAAGAGEAAGAAAEALPVPTDDLGRPAGTRAAVNALQFSPDQKYLVVGTDDSYIKCYHAATGFLMCSVDCSGSIMDVDIAPNNRTLAASLNNGSITVFMMKDKLSAVTRICEADSEFRQNLDPAVWVDKCRRKVPTVEVPDALQGIDLKETAMVLRAKAGGKCAIM